jgi:predicted cupin superfamily sugar epimerase
VTATARDIVERLGLAPHPEGGYFREIYRDVPPSGGRGAVTSIHFLLAGGQASHWHRVDAHEVWHFHAGAPLILSLAETDAGPVETVTLGPDPLAGHAPQAVVPPNAWQAARTAAAQADGWSLVGCTVAPAFTFDGFEMAPEGWSPG